MPQFYLRNFADGVGRQARVVFFDEETRHLGHTLVRNVGSKRYFNRVDAEGQDPDYLENALADLEGEISGPLADIIAAQNFPSEEHFTYVMNLAALLSVRNPQLRGQLERFHQDVVEKVFGVLVSSEEAWEHHTKKMKDDGVELSGKVTYEDIKRFKDGKRYDINIDQTHLIGVEFEMVPKVLETMANRNWCFASAPEGSQYITSDNPVVLEWSDNRDYGPLASPGHGLMGTSLLFPLSSDALLLGTFEELPETLSHTDDQVTSVNTVIARNSRRQIYARNDQFRLNLRSEQNVRGADLPKYFRRTA
ncbi:DUF4238 domain-containing protein [Erythrobacter vulgaris]|uniref:DUF4238 domain-containing protein n=1 Tax=Qipengyuania vulgaris TaxID=291985 RepID=A0A844XV23_9SPHN|nr:DUF4238 domain-containing protein [Qipengyuania vulgaris]